MSTHASIGRIYSEPARGPRRTSSQDACRWPLVAVAVAAVAWGANQFAPMLLVYPDELGISAATAQATFGLYAIGLVPGLLLGGPLSDRRGRRPVLTAALVASVLASSLLLAGGSAVGWLFAGRLVAGMASGAAFSAGSAWIKELAPADFPGLGARRAVVAMTAGFAVGPLVAGALAEWAPAPTVVPYVPHLVIACAGVPLALLAPETVIGRPSVARRFSELRNPRFQHVVAPLAPWVFGAAAIPMAYLPGVVQHRIGDSALVFGAVVAALTAAAGIAIQPIARRVDGPDRPRLLIGALSLVVAGMLIAADSAADSSPALVVVAAIVLGAAYGALQVCGLLEVQRLAPPTALAGMTAVYQAFSYLGFALPFLLAALAGTLAPATGLVLLAALAALTLAVTARASVSDRTEHHA
jgi:predicted MFS family arabinose efflux permease